MLLNLKLLIENFLTRGPVGSLAGPAYPETASWVFRGGFYAYSPPVVAASTPVPSFRTGLYPYSSPDALVQPQFFRFPFYQATPQFPSIRYGQLPLPESVSFPVNGFQRFPYLAASLFPASPVIPPRTRSLSELETVPLPEGSRSEYRRFPYLAATLFPSYPVIGYRYGRPLLADVDAWVPGRFLPFPWQSTVIAPANPIIRTLFGSYPVLAEEFPVRPQRFPFPFYAVNPSLPRFRYGQLQPDSQPWMASGGYARFPFVSTAAPAPASPAVPYRYGLYPEAAVAALVVSQFYAFPTVVVAAPSPPIVPGPIPDVIRDNYTGPPGRITSPWDYPPLRGSVFRGRV